MFLEISQNSQENTCAWHKCFTVNFAKFLKTPFIIEHLWQLLLNLGTFKSNHLKNFFGTVSPIILTTLWTIWILWTISVFLWTITVINFNRASENLDLWMILILLTFSYWSFCKAVSNHQKKFSLINFISTYHNWLKNFSFTHFLLIKGYGKYSPRKVSVITPFGEWFKTPRELSSWIFLVLIQIRLKPFSFPDFLMIENREQSALPKKIQLLLFS